MRSVDGSMTNCSNDDEIKEELDLEFREILKHIKPYVTRINSTNFLNQYRIWLEKLSEPNWLDKIKRNQYLRELAKQIKNQTLLPPFTETPCEEILAKDRLYKFNSTRFQNRSLPRNFSSKKCFELMEDCEEVKKPLTKKRKRPKSCLLSFRKNVQNNCEQIDYNQIMDTVKSVRQIFESNLVQSSSWVDLSDSASCDNVKNLPSVLPNEEGTSTKEEECIKPLNLKSCPADSNVIVTDLKKTIEGLQLRLTETINQNKDLKSEIEILNKIKKENRENKFQDFGSKTLEDSFQQKLDTIEKNYQKQLEHVKEIYETKLNCACAEKAQEVQEKDKQICKLNDIIEKQCIRIANEITALRAKMVECLQSNSNDEKVAFLQKCVSKMDRLFQKSEREYQKQIDKLKHNLEQREKSVQILLQSQRMEVISKTSVEKQTQFDAIVDKLETKYRKMLDVQTIQSQEVIKKQQKTIDQLKQILTKHHIPYDNNL